jgi:pentatricopeptide repeat protein
MIPRQIRGFSRLTTVSCARNASERAVVARLPNVRYSIPHTASSMPRAISKQTISAQSPFVKSYTTKSSPLQELKEATNDGDIPRIHTAYRALVAGANPQALDKEALRKLVLTLRKGKMASDVQLLQRIIADMEPVFNLPVSHFELHALIYCYGVQRNPTAAYRVLQDIQRQGLIPNIYTYNTMMGVYKAVKDSGKAMSLLREMQQQEVEPDVNTYNTLISLLASNSEYDKARSLYNDMEQRGIHPNQYTFSTLLKIAASTHDERLGNNVLEYICDNEAKRNETDITTFNSMLLFLSEIPGSFDKLFELYSTANSSFPHLRFDLITYNTMLDACLKQDLPSKGVKIMDDLSQAGLKPDVVTYGIMIDAQARSNNIDEAMTLYSEMSERGIRANERVLSSLVNAAAKGDDRQIADVVNTIETTSYRESIRPDRVAFNALLNALTLKGKAKEAQHLFDTVFHEKNSSRFHHPDTATYTSLITAYTKSGDLDTALDIYYAVKEKHVPARRRKAELSNTITLDTQFFTALITSFTQTATDAVSTDYYNDDDNTQLSYAPSYIYSVEDDDDRRHFIDGDDHGSAALATALALFTDMRQLQIRPNAHTYTTLLNAAAKHQDDFALEQIHKLIKMDLYLDPDIAIYNGLMNAYNRTGQGHEVVQIWDTLSLSSTPTQDKNIDQASVSIVLDSCAHNGYGYKAQQIWDSLKRYQFSLNTNNYNSYIEALCRLKGEEGWEQAYAIAQNEMIPQTSQHSDSGIPIDTKTVNTLISFARKKGFSEERIQQVIEWGQSALLENQSL